MALLEEERCDPILLHPQRACAVGRLRHEHIGPKLAEARGLVARRVARAALPREPTQKVKQPMEDSLVCLRQLRDCVANRRDAKSVVVDIERGEEAEDLRLAEQRDRQLAHVRRQRRRRQPHVATRCRVAVNTVATPAQMIDEVIDVPHAWLRPRRRRTRGKCESALSSRHQCDGKVGTHIAAK